MDNSPEELTPLGRREGFVIQQLADEVVVYDLERHRAHCLNLTAAAIWRLCDGRTSVSEMASQLRARGDATVDVFEHYVHLHVAELARHRLFVHAGVVGWRGRAILIPGRSLSGKSSLVAALLQSGATYYTVAARREPALALGTLQRAAGQAKLIKSARGEASRVAPLLLGYLGS